MSRRQSIRPRIPQFYSGLTIFAIFTFIASALSTSLPPTAHNANTEITLAPRADTNSTKPFLLRVMPLGASITVGYQSNDGNGYRKYLREQLRYAGWEVDMVGSLTNGTMKDNQNEGHFGDTIDAIESAALRSASMQPNLILINVGTNDGLQNNDISDADSRIDTLITNLFTAIPNTTIILSTLLPNTHAQRVVSRISREYRNLAGRRRSAGDRVVLAEMSYFIGSEMLVDGTHPDNQGYKNMAAVWWAAVQTAESEGLLSAPNEVRGGGKVAVVAGTGSGNGTVKEGEGLDDGPVEDPELPGYIAPAQPGDEGTGGASGIAAGVGGGVLSWGFWVVMLVGVGELIGCGFV
ncbi:SGNH hydrolase-type esterase domain-containing protein [Aspergillus karnatakaensis]|uniref:SGNH/GDSL hydrolase family protein n=1 Tax=Aspergillus karnatakaensis TaxID=1810916 RepID=UPI003CCDDE6B